MGLLDELSSFAATPEGQGLLSMVAGGMAGARRGQPWNTAGIAGVSGLTGYSAALNRQDRTSENAMQNKIRQMQMDEMQKKLAEQAKVENFYSTVVPSLMSPKPEFAALADGAGPTLENAAKIPQMPQGGTIDNAALYRSMVNSGIPSLASTGLQGLTKQDEPIKVGRGDRLVAKTPSGFTTVLDALPDPEKDPEFIRLMASYQAMPPGPMKDLLGNKLKTAASHAPAASAKVVMPPAENAQQQEWGKSLGAERTKIMQKAFMAPAKLKQLDRMEQLLEGVEGGKLAPIGTDIASAAASFGIKIDPKLGNKEAATALALEMAASLREPGTGIMTDKDFDNFVRRIPDLSKTPAGRREITKTMRAILTRDQKVAQLTRAHATKNGGNITDSLADEIAELYANEPVVSSGGGGFKIIGVTD